MKQPLLLLALSVFLLPASLVAQHHLFQKYSVNIGLPHGQVHSVFQTSDGYMWIGTYGGGVSKFDGQDFTTYTTSEGLKDNSVEVIYEDSAENLWFATYQSGIARMEGNSFVYPFEDTSLDTADIYGIGELSTGELWIATLESGLYIYDGATLEQFTAEGGLVGNTVWDVWEGKDGNLWITANGGISVFNRDGFTNYTIHDGLSGQNVYQVTPHSNGDLWFATSSGITIWDGSSFAAIREIEGMELDYIYDLVADSEGNMWIGTYSNGVMVYSDHLINHFTRSNGLTSNYIYDLYEDQDENIWIATDGGGINVYEGDAFIMYKSESGLTSPNVYSLFKDSRGTIWAGTNNGIFFKEDGNYQELPIPEEYEVNKEVWDITELDNGDLLFLMPDNAIYQFDGNEFTNFSKKHNIELRFTYQLYIDQHNALWISTDVGLFYKKGDELIHYTRRDGLPSNIVYQVYEHKGFLWIATYNGISRFNGSEFKNYRTEEGVAHRDITYITDRQDNLWIGTGGGISLLDLDGEGDVSAIENFGRETGMEVVTTQLLWFDEAGKLWQGTNGGINRLDVPRFWESGDMRLRHYRLSERGIGIETNQGAVLPIEENRVLFGTMEGILELRPSQIDQKYDLDLHITQIYRNSQEVEWDTYSDTLRYKFGRILFPEVNFPHGQHAYEFKYKGFIFGNTSNIRYRYRLEGFDKGWTEPTQSETAIFTNLDPGDYSFVVQAKNGDSEWAANQASYNFSVAFPFWQTYWFYLIVGLSLIAIIYGYIQFHIQRHEKRHLKSLVDEQTKELQNALDEKEVLIKEIHHRVKNNLAVISGLLELQIGYSDDHFSEKVLRESQRRVQSISMIHEKLYQNKRLAEINFKKYIEELTEIISFSNNSEEKDIDVEVGVDDIHLSIDQGIPCGLILSELLSNAYEHAFEGRTSGTIVITFVEDEEGGITFCVEDDGVGLPEKSKEKARESLGLTLIQTLTQQLGGTLSIDRLSEGTRFTIKFLKEEPKRQVPVEV